MKTFWMLDLSMRLVILNYYYILLLYDNNKYYFCLQINTITQKNKQIN